MRGRVGVWLGVLSVVGMVMLVVVPIAGAARAKPHIAFVAQSGDSADYGEVVVGDSKSQTFILTNDGGRATSRLTASLSDSSTFTKTADTCSGKGLKPGVSCTVTVEYAPTVAQKDASSILAVNLNGNVRASIDLSGTGVNPLYELTWSPTSHDFGTTGGTFSFTLTNTGNQPVAAQGLQSSSGGTSRGSGLGFDEDQFHACLPGFAMAVGASCTVDATFAPAACDVFPSLAASVTVDYFTDAAHTTTARAQATATGTLTPCG
jgi:hypothetical protein